MTAVANASAILDLIQAQLGTRNPVLMVTFADFTGWTKGEQFTDAYIAGATPIAVTAFAGKGNFKDTYQVGP